MSAPQALGTFGVYGQASDDEIAVLALADEYRERLCTTLHSRHRRLIDLRNNSCPELFAAMIEFESSKAAIWWLEKEIKKHHSDTRDKNAMLAEQRARLEQLRERRGHWQRTISELRRPWLDSLRARAMYWSSLADWKNVKSLEKREKLYDAIEWPETGEPYRILDVAQQAAAESEARAEGKECTRKPLGTIDPAVIAAIGRLEMECDLEQRKLSVEFQGRGLHSAIRAEIVESSKPKLTKTGPGMRYEYHRAPEPKPWEKISIHFASGLPVSESIDGDNTCLCLTPIYTQHKANREHTVYEVRHQIGTADHPRQITYRAKFHRPLPTDGTIRRWSLVVRESGKREVIPIVKNHGLVKPTGDGVVGFDLTWRSTPDGIQVCHFLGTHVNERLILPRWLINARLAVSAARQECDHLANEEIIERTGSDPEAGKRQGVAALEDYCGANPLDNGAFNKLEQFNRTISRATKVMRRAVRCIEKIYETVARRVCSLHSEIMVDPIDLASIRRYDTRDLLRFDPLPSRSREYLAAVSPGKLSALLTGYGLARADVLPETVGPARGSDIFTSWVLSLAKKSGRKENQKTGRSQHAPAMATV